MDCFLCALFFAQKFVGLEDIFGNVLCRTNIPLRIKIKATNAVIIKFTVTVFMRELLQRTMIYVNSSKGAVQVVRPAEALSNPNGALMRRSEAFVRGTYRRAPD